MAPPQIAEEGELTDDQSRSADLQQGAVHPAPLVREYPHAGHPRGESSGRAHLVLRRDAEVDQKSGANLGNRLVGHRDPGLKDQLDDGSQGSADRLQSAIYPHRLGLSLQESAGLGLQSLQGEPPPPGWA